MTRVTAKQPSKAGRKIYRNPLSRNSSSGKLSHGKSQSAASSKTYRKPKVGDIYKVAEEGGDKPKITSWSRLANKHIDNDPKMPLITHMRVCCIIGNYLRLNSCEPNGRIQTNGLGTGGEYTEEEFNNTFVLHKTGALEELYEEAFLDMIQWPKELLFNEELACNTNGMQQKFGIQAGFTYTWHTGFIYNTILGFKEYKGKTLVFLATYHKDNIGTVSYIIHALTLNGWMLSAPGFVKRTYFNFNDMSTYKMNMNEFKSSLVFDNCFFKEAIKHVKAQDAILAKRQEKHDEEIVKKNIIIEELRKQLAAK